MKLIPKRKQISGTEKPTIIIQQAAQTAADSVGATGGVTGSDGWFPHRLRIPVGADMFNVGTATSGKYECYNTGDTGDEIVYTNLWWAQTFTPSTAHKIISVNLFLYRTGSPSTITVGIRGTDVNSHPTGSDLCSGTTDGNTLPTTLPYEWRETTMGDGYNLSANIKYAIVVRATGGDINNYVQWRDNRSSPTYTGGCEEYSLNSGSSWTSTSYDFMFWEGEEWDTTVKTGFIWVEADDLHHTDAFGTEQINVNQSDIDDIPLDGVTTAPVSSNWAYDHGTAADPHTGYRLESADHTHQTTGAQAGQVDHGAAMVAASLLDDDHTQYLLRSILTTQGDLLLQGASVAERLAKITTGEYLKATATGYEGGTPAGGTTPTSGSYTGTGAANLAIAHGLGKIPTLISIVLTTGGYHYLITKGLAKVMYDAGTPGVSGVVTEPDATNFYVGNAGNYPQSANLLNAVYIWVAIG